MSNQWKAISEFADVNPKTARPSEPRLPVSFIPMSDISESGRWTGEQTRQLGSVANGFTAFRDEDVLFAKITPCMENGKGALVKGLCNGIGFGSTEFHVLRAKPGKAHPGYIFQWLKSPEVRERAKAFFVGSAGQQRVSVSFFDKLHVPELPYGEQRRIAEVLSALDEEIETTEAMVHKFDVTRVGLVRDLLSAVDDSPRVPLKQLAAVGSGVTLGREFTGSGTAEYPYLRVANVQDGRIDLAEVKTIRIPVASAARAMLQPGDVLMNEGGDFDKLGRGAVWNGEIPNCLHQNHVFRVRCDQSQLLPGFLALWAASDFGKRFFILASKQSTNLASINSTQLKSFPVLKPSIEKQREILDAIEAFDAVQAANKAEVCKLRSQKQGLMSDLLTGRVRVSHGDKQ